MTKAVFGGKQKNDSKLSSGKKTSFTWLFHDEIVTNIDNAFFPPEECLGSFFNLIVVFQQFCL